LDAESGDTALKKILKKIAATFPLPVQQELKRYFFAYQIRKDRFVTSEKEFASLDRLVSPGDWVLDIGANIGQYTKRFSDLVGSSGRVIAFEPVPDTFELLAANAQHFRQKNVTLFNAAASDECSALGMSIPTFDTGLSNYYEAHISASSTGLQILTFPIDSFQLPHAIRLAKIDAEGHEMAVLRGMERLLTRDHPTLIVETFTADVENYLRPFGYGVSQIANSSNKIFTQKDVAIQ
jgi:FkbM family methyltransferase